MLADGRSPREQLHWRQDRKIMETNLKRKPNAPRTRRSAATTLALRHILVPLDFSGLSRQALDCAVPLARKYGAKISLVHVAQSPFVMSSFPEGGIVLPVNTDKLVSVAKTHLAELAAQLLPDELRGRTIVREGNAATEVVAAAKALKADLIVLSTHGRSGLKRVLLGSTAERILRHAHCPVLTVRRQEGEPAMRLLAQTKPLYPKQLPWRRILVPLDLSPASLRALQTAVALARASAARLLLLNVVEPNPYVTGMEGAVLLIPDRDLMDLAKQQLPRVARKFVPKSVPVTSMVGRGRAADVIGETAEAEGVDLIVLATHGHTGWDRLLMGSTAEQVVRHAKCPVFVARILPGWSAVGTESKKQHRK